MTLKTRKIRINVANPDGSAAASAALQAELTSYEVDGELIVPALVRGQTDATGTALLDLWPNARGTAGSQYRIKATKAGALLLNVLCTVPDGNAATEVLLESIITAQAPATVDDAQAAVLQAQALVDAATTQAGIATTKAQATAADAAATAADVLATHADVQATGNAADAAAAAAQAAATLYDNFDDRYLGAKAADPTTDNDGNALLVGALYFNTTVVPHSMRVWSGTIWDTAYATLGDALSRANNLSELADPATARGNLGLGSAAIHASTDFDAAGAAAAAQADAIAAAATDATTKANAAAAAVTPTSLSLVIGTNVQAYDSDLTTWAGITPGTGVATALAVNTGSAGSVLLNGDAFGAPSVSSIATLGAELFPSLQAANLTYGTGWDAPAGTLVKSGDGTGTITITSPPTIVAGTVYKIVVTLSAWSVGSATLECGDMRSSLYNSTGTWTCYVTAQTTDPIKITPTNTARFTISAVSIKPITTTTGNITVGDNLFLTGSIYGNSDSTAASGPVALITFGPPTNVSPGSMSGSASDAINIKSSVSFTKPGTTGHMRWFASGANIFFRNVTAGGRIDFQVENGAFTSYSIAATGSTIIGGSAVGAGLTLKSTSGVGTTDFVKVLVGNNGGTQPGLFTIAGFDSPAIGATTPGTGAFTTLSATGIVTPGTFTTGTRPTKTLGGIIFDTTLNKLLVGGASAWEVVTSV